MWAALALAGVGVGSKEGVVMAQEIIRCRVRCWPFGVTDWHTLAEVHGGYAVHQRYGEQAGYTVTQVSSGLAVVQGLSRQAAIRAAKEADGEQVG